MAIAEDRFFETRAVQLAIVHLTRRPDVRVTQEPHEDGVDLLVSLLKNGKNVGRLLAVEVKAATSETMIPGAYGKDWRPDAILNSYYFPLCLFVFSMDHDRGYWRWVRKPELHAPGRRHLVSVEDGPLEPLTDAAMNRMLDAVRDWYDS